MDCSISDFYSHLVVVFGPTSANLLVAQHNVRHRRRRISLPAQTGRGGGGTGREIGGGVGTREGIVKDGEGGLKAKFRV